MIPRAQYGTAFLGGILLLYIAIQLPDTIETSNWPETAALVLSGAITLVTTLYIWTNFHQLYVQTSGRATQFEIVLALLFTLAMIYLTWRSFCSSPSSWR